MGGGGGGGDGRVRGVWGEGKMDGQTNKPKPIRLFSFFEVVGHNNALMYKLCKLCP